jgi:hypothetical protein
MRVVFSALAAAAALCAAVAAGGGDLHTFDDRIDAQGG